MTDDSERKISDVDLTVKNEEIEIPVTEVETNTPSPSEENTPSLAEVNTPSPAKVNTPSPAEVTNVDEQKEDTESSQANIPSDKDHDENAEKETENISPSNDIKRTKLTPTDLSLQSSHLYEKSRGSSVYEQEDLVLQNANFRLSALSNI